MRVGFLFGVIIFIVVLIVVQLISVVTDEDDH